MYAKNKYCLTWKTHSKHVFKSLCCLMEHQSLVDIAICCGNKTLHAHKCILAANSHYFKEEMERNSSVEQIIITGFDFTVLRAIIEFMYCGETTINEEDVKYLIAAAKLLQIRGLDTLFSDRQEYQHIADDVYIPYPQFISSKPKYPIAYHPPSNTSISNGNGLNKLSGFCMSDQFNKKKIKRKYLRSEAEKACAKEAHASRMALAHLQKEIATTSQVNSFIIEESCTETTVENFIPNTEDHCIEVSKGMQSVPLITFTDSESGFSCNPTVVNPKPNLLQFGPTASSQTVNPEKLKNLFGSDPSSNIEIIFKTSDGSFMTVNEEVLQNISKGGLQYQIVDENGHVGEVQDFKPIERASSGHVESRQSVEMLKDCMKNTKISCNASGSICDSENVNEGSRNEDNDIGQVDFKETEDTLNIESSGLDDRKPIQFMLLENGEFDSNLMNSFPQSVKICVDKNFTDGDIPKVVGDDFSDFVQEIGDEEVDVSEKSTLKFSPDIFFAESSPINMSEKKMLTLRKT